MDAAEQSLPAAAPATPMPDLSRPERRIAAFDGMRAIAVLLVMVGHAGFFFQGFMGVDIFFVLSGYLITSILLDELAKTGHFSFRNFYMRRILRLYPALVLLVILNLIETAMVHHRMDRAFGDSAIVLAYLSNWTKAFGDRPSTLAHTWSLSIEEQFYLLWPAMALGVYWLLGRTRKAAIACLMAALAIVWYRHWMEARPLPSGDFTAVSHRRFYRIYFGLDTRGDDLLAGAMLAFWTPKLPRIFAAVIGWLGVLTLLGYALLTPVRHPDGMHQILWGLNIPVPANLTWGDHPYAYIWLCTVAILLGILNDRHGWLARILSLKPLAWVGVISYGLYLYHFPIVIQLTEWKWSRWQILALELPLTFLIAVISFYALERPCLKLKEHFRPGAKIPKGFPLLGDVMPQETKSMPGPMDNPDNLEHAPGFVHEKLEGWIPAMASENEIREALEKAFDYRGDITITQKSGDKVEGYIFDRRPGKTLADSAVRLFPKDRDEKIAIPYDQIAALAFTGRDTAAGKGWETWLKKYNEKKAAGETNIGLEPEKLE